MKPRPATRKVSRCERQKRKKVGPELTGGLALFRLLEYFLESTLKPSAKIIKGYETMYVITTDGIPL